MPACSTSAGSSVTATRTSSRIYNTEGNEDIAAGFRSTFGRDCPVELIGVWDTVASLVINAGKRWHDHTLNPEVKFGYHALAIDQALRVAEASQRFRCISLNLALHEANAGRVGFLHVCEVHDMIVEAHDLRLMQVITGLDRDGAESQLATLLSADGPGTERLDTPADVHVLGARDDVEHLLPAADLIVSTSVSEGFSNVLAEGMAAGLPAVATGVGDSARIVGATGRIVPLGEPAALAEAMASLLRGSKDARTARGVEARNRIEGRFSVAQAVNAHGALYASIESPDHDREPGSHRLGLLRRRRHGP